MGMLKTIVGSRVPEKYRKYFDLPARTPSSAIVATADTALGVAAGRWLDRHPGRNGVYRLDLGIDALAIRVGLIDVAESSVDIQSYLIRDDLSGNLIAMRLIEAAERGVRVRLLMDDALTEDIDAGLLSLTAHPNIEVRVFNPFPRRKSRFVSFIWNFNILNRRMHNKSFTVDNQVTIVGGRNIGDEYFQADATMEFLDEDLLAIGPVVNDVAVEFDEFWNAQESIPVQVFQHLVEHRTLAATIDEGRRYLGSESATSITGRVSASLTDRLLAAELPLVPAAAEIVSDHPDKVRGFTREQVGETTRFLQAMVSAAAREVLIVSPYFVPQKAGVEFLAGLVARGIRVLVVTNSLASTNHPSVHAVYSRYRKALLQGGVELFELRPRLISTIGEPDAMLTTLHSKVAVVDRERLFVGSFNLDPRSLYINTEMGMVVTSAPLAGEMAQSIESVLPATAYRLQLSARGRLRWHFRTRRGEQQAVREPDTTMWRRLRTWLMGLLPIEGQM